MEFTKQEIKAVEVAANSDQATLTELDQSALCLVGGGCGEVIVQ